MKIKTNLSLLTKYSRFVFGYLQNNLLTTYSNILHKLFQLLHIRRLHRRKVNFFAWGLSDMQLIHGFIVFLS